MRRLCCLLLASAASGAGALPVPRDVYTFWHSGSLPDLVARCVQSWQTHCHGCRIHVLNADSIADTVTWKEAWRELPANFQADLARAQLLAERGGVWLDATVAAVDGSFFERAFSEASSGAMVGFDIDLAFPPVDFKRGLSTGNWTFLEELRPAPAGDPRRLFEFWALAAARGSQSMAKFRDEMVLALGGGWEAAEQYSEDWKRRFAAAGPRHELLMGWLPYLTTHAALLSTIARGGILLSAEPAEEYAYSYLRYTPSGLLTRLMRPTDYSMDGTGMPIFALGRSLGAKPPPPPLQSLAKFRALERDPLRHVMACAAYANDSPLRSLLGLKPVPSWWPVDAVQLLAGLSLLLERERNLPCRCLSLLLQWCLQGAAEWGLLMVLLLPLLLLLLAVLCRARQPRQPRKED